jgi:hypothetical protein
MIDDLTQQEVAAFRLLRLGVRRNPCHQVTVGLVVRWHSLSSWQVALGFGFFDIVLRFNTLAAYREQTLALGPYRNA